jgi:SWI/SNF-related matrix-associated actin-dependent regulator 1 of chromatin subfamily A
MPVLTYNSNRKIFLWRGTFDERILADNAKFVFDRRMKLWKTKDITRAIKLQKYADESAKKIFDKFKKTLTESRSTDCGINIPCPEDLKYLNFQKSGIRFSITKNASFIFDDMGLGKTIQAIGIMNFIGVTSALVLCPVTPCDNWLNKINDWHMMKPTVQIIRTAKDIVSDKDIIICPYSLTFKEPIVDQLKTKRFTYGIFDEVHHLKNPEAKKSKAILGITKHKKKKDEKKPQPFAIKDICEKHILLSGTPIDNRPIEFFPVLKALAPDVIDNMSYWGFAKKYCGAYDTGYGWFVNGASNLEELNGRLRSTVMIRREKKEVLKELPEKIYETVYLPTNRDAKALLQLEKDLENSEIGDLPSIRKKLGLLKIKTGVEFIKDLMDNGLEKLVIFAHHKDVISKLVTKLRDYGVVSITGSTPSKKRQIIADQFQTDDAVKIMIANIEAAGEAIDLFAASYVIDFEFDWRPGKQDQAHDRLHRIGQIFTVYVISLLFKNSFDDLKMLESHRVKRRNIYRALDKPLEV